MVKRTRAHHFFFHVDQMSGSLIVVQQFVHLQYFLYHYMRNFCNLIGSEQWYFSLI